MKAMKYPNNIHLIEMQTILWNIVVKRYGENIVFGKRWMVLILWYLSLVSISITERLFVFPTNFKQSFICVIQCSAIIKFLGS